MYILLYINYIMVLFKNENLVIEEFEENELVILEKETGTMHSLNSSASLLFKLCDYKSKQEIIDQFLYFIIADDLDYAIIREELNVCLEELISKGLIMVGNKE